MIMSFFDRQAIYQHNNKIRENLLNEALKQETPAKQIQFVADYFLNQLPVETIANIDGVSKSNVEPFAYDYSYLDDFTSPLIRKQTPKTYATGMQGITLPAADDIRVGLEHISIYPTIYALKLGTCKMFANEIRRLCHDLNIKGKIHDELANCYDKFDGTSTTGKPINTNRIMKMHHYYNIITIDDVDYKLDIAGALTAMDYNKNQTGLFIDPARFYFSQELETNPFDAAVAGNLILTSSPVSVGSRQPE